MKCYAVIDTNVLVSALLAKHENSATVKVVNHLFDGTVIPVFSESILAEYGDVLRREKFGFDPELVDTFLILILTVAYRVELNCAALVETLFFGSKVKNRKVASIA